MPSLIKAGELGQYLQTSPPLHSNSAYAPSAAVQIPMTKPGTPCLCRRPYCTDSNTCNGARFAAPQQSLNLQSQCFSGNTTTRLYGTQSLYSARPSATHCLMARWIVRRLPVPKEPKAVTEIVKPYTPLQHQLLHLWQNILDNEAIGIEHNFFRMGGDSLQAIRLSQRIKGELRTGSLRCDVV